MGNWVHRISQINAELRTAVCESCGPVRIKSKGPKGGARWRCAKGKKRYRSPFYDKPYRKNLLKTCERCPFVPEDACQLDIHHLDGNHDNDDPANLQTLCANCHRLVTKREREKKKAATR